MKSAKSNCRSCARQTNHDIVFEIDSEGENDFYEEKYVWQTLRCKGCDTIGFRSVYIDYEDMDEREPGVFSPSRTYTRYPAAIAGHKQLDFLWATPVLIRKIYLETVSSFSSGSKVLSGMGLRAIIEAVCNHLKVSGRSLDKRIDLLYKNGSISSADKKRLHAIRFLGNDAAHEIREPSSAELKVALEIVEHLIKSVFILGKRAEDLDTAVESLEDLLPVLKKCCAKIELFSIHSLASILGVHLRRLGDSFPTLEQALRDEISNGGVSFLAIDVVQTADGKNIQTYKLVQKQDELDFPF